MEHIKSKPLSSLIFVPLLSLIFIRPFFSGLAYPGLESFYEYCIIFLAIITIFFSTREVYPERSRGPRSKNILRQAHDYIVRARPKAESRTNLCNLSIFLLLSAYLISTVFSVNIQNSIRETIKFISYFSIFFMVSVLDSGQKKILIKIIVFAAVIIGIYSIYQYFWGYQHTIDYLKKINSDLLATSSYAKDILIAKRAIGTFPSPNILGGYLIITFFLSLQILFERGSKFIFSTSSKNKFATESRTILVTLFKISPLIITIFALLLTKSLGAWLSLIITLIVFSALSYRSIKHKRAVFIFSLITAIAVICFIFAARGERLTNLENPQSSIAQRLDYWRTAINIIKDHPILGIGPGNFQEVFLKYKIGLSTDTRYAHNIFLHTWAETGILGLVAISYLILNFIRQFRTRPEAKFIFISGLAFLIHNLVDNTYLIPETGVFLWILLGLIC